MSKEIKLNRFHLAEGVKPLLLVVMDGVGWTTQDHGNAVLHANIPTLRALAEKGPFRTLKAHGTAVGLPGDGDMGNSEVGHNALGSGQIYAQGAKLVNLSLEDGSIFQSDCWKQLIAHVGAKGTLHFLGLLSDGNVHSHIKHLEALMTQAKNEGVKRVAVHILLDGRDVGAQTSLTYVDELEAFMAGLNDESFSSFIASGGGRMLITMDRYEADWGMVEKGWHTHVLGEAPQFASAREAILAARKADPEISDQYLPAFVVARDGKALAPVKDGDSFVLFNFRGDRALEISRAFEGGSEFKAFDRVRVPDVFYAGMLEYDGDLHIPKHYLVNPPKIRYTLSEQLIAHGIAEYAVSETQKYGHVTYFWNGNRLEKFSEELEDWDEIPSDLVTFDKKPWMKAYEITEKLIATMEQGKYGFIRCNFPNGDMVGHTGNYDAAVIAIETVDLCLARLEAACDAAGYSMMVLADHGNCDEMEMPRKKDSDPIVPKTSHTLAPVPFALYGVEGVRFREGDFGLANVAATVADLLRIEPNEHWEPSTIEIK